MTDTKSPLPGWNMLLMGPTGTGKTYSIRTLVNAGITPFCVFTEPGFEVLGDIPPEKLHWRYIKPADQPWQAMIDNAEKLNALSFKTLAEMAPTDKRNFHQFVDLLGALNNYKCDRDGKSYGDVCTWNTDRALVIDGLSGVSIMAMRLWVGSKSLLNQGDWGVAMTNLESFVQKLCMDTQCNLVLIAHSERELDEVSGGSKIMVSTLGRKLAPKIPRYFSDVVMAVRDGNKFSWSTAVSGADLKARNLPIADGISPDFTPVVQSWKSRGGLILETKL